MTRESTDLPFPTGARGGAPGMCPHSAPGTGSLLPLSGS